HVVADYLERKLRELIGELLSTRPTSSLEACASIGTSSTEIPSIRDEKPPTAVVAAISTVAAPEACVPPTEPAEVIVSSGSKPVDNLELDEEQQQSSLVPTAPLRSLEFIVAVDYLTQTWHSLADLDAPRAGPVKKQPSFGDGSIFQTTCNPSIINQQWEASEAPSPFPNAEPSELTLPVDVCSQGSDVQGKGKIDEVSCPTDSSNPPFSSMAS
ncbi:unnamed protein product, partial [Sphacelaria rigidula]